MIIEMYCWCEGGIHYGFTKEALENSTVTIDGVEKIALDRVPEDVQIHTISLKENFYRSNRMKVEASLHVLNQRTGLYDYQQYRLYDAFAAEAISEWDFKREENPSERLPITEDSIGRLHDKVAENLVNAIWRVYNDDLKPFRKTS